ncbi:Bcr/CflA family drug resistance efflux transporter [Brevibacillus reuszeri]|uniref:Bcr/CflA family efflux transporter n=1 Tax=Brevibacillus reuszeri TaxID=54915 RepID=A0A0K9YJD0_9BACL|nr:multidrug effflux MFS transporter [Brevibacillus reuszeri]KNB68761.1 multidrug transporter CflA [Brevibacillus reuszeri]MED1859059.1 multidrug effflux MFS transporter [Brevibacillus reuszeri]GED69277.1 Bcr/CflA family drug resistance efflux transporter [Brevibacillus reuszeri]
MERKISTPSLLLFIILVGFPQISETIYTPSLPDIASQLQTSGNAIQLTLSIYFLGFAFGVFCWGRLSDSIGRRRAMLWGILVYGLGSLGCYLSDSIEWLLLSRFIQAFGASTGSVVTQTILRESIEGAKRHAVFAQISAALAFSPAIGPLIGGWVDQSLGFHAVFLTLVVMSVAIYLYTFTSLPETRVASPVSIRTASVAKRLLSDRRVWSFAFLIGATNGILFSYYAEAPFIFIDFFGMTPGMFGFLGIFVALSSVLGAMLSKRLLGRLPAEKIILIGSLVTTLGAICLTGFTLIGMSPSVLSFAVMVVSIFILLLGIGIAIPNCLSLALVNYSDVLGTAGAILGLSYYVVVSLITSGMSYLHNGSLVTMPLYFLLLAIVMVLVSGKLKANVTVKG